MAVSNKSFKKVNKKKLIKENIKREPIKREPIKLMEKGIDIKKVRKKY